MTATGRPTPVQLRRRADQTEWLEVDDPESDVRWRFDATFLRSGWRCVYGDGCKGIHPTQDPARADGCCTVGAQLTDAFDFQSVSAAVARVAPAHWQHAAHARRKGWYKRRADGTIATRVVDGGCIFLNRPGFAGGPGCALHRSAVALGEHPVEWKPYVCWQLPLRREEQTVDGRAVSVLRRWSSADWGSDGAHLTWWCTEADEAFDSAEPVWRSLAYELRAIVGNGVYDELNRRLATPR